MKILEVTQGSGTATKDTRVFKRLSYYCSDAKHLSTINSAVVTGKWRIERNFHSIHSGFIQDGIHYQNQP